MLTIILKGASNTASRPRLPQEPQSAPPTQPTPRPSLDLKPRTEQLEEAMTKAKTCRETIVSIYRSQSTFLYDRFRASESGGTHMILWIRTSLRLVFDTAKFSTRLDGAAEDTSTHYNSPLFRTHPYGYNFLVQFYPYGLDSAEGNHAQFCSVYSPKNTMGY